jgi:2-oxoglutarate ferredoxin oxidoreductase subunit beta
VRIIQRCPEFLPTMWEPWLREPQKTLLLTHENGLKYSDNLTKVYKNQQRHDPSDINRAREIASGIDPVPVGILYQNAEVPCYEDVRRSDKLRDAELIRTGLEAEFDKFTIWPDSEETEKRARA